MKLLSVSDLHGYQEWIEWVVQVAPDYDAILFPGDLIEGQAPESSKQCERVFELLRGLSEKGVPVIYCSGNHDLELRSYVTQFKDQLEGVSGDNEYLRIGDLRLRAHPYSFPANLDFTDCHILLHHEPPEHTPIAMDSDGKSFGSYSLRARLETTPERFPELILCGHQHYAKTHFHRIGKSLICNSGQVFWKNGMHYFEIEVNWPDFKIVHYPTLKTDSGTFGSLAE